MTDRSFDSHDARTRRLEEGLIAAVGTETDGEVLTTALARLTALIAWSQYLCLDTLFEAAEGKLADIREAARRVA